MTASAQLVQSSFQRLLEIDPKQNFIKEFFVSLRAQDPQIRALFDEVSWEHQHNKFLLALVLIVENLEDPGHYRHSLESMGIAHLQKYGVTVDMIPAFRAALLNTLEINLGDEWTKEVEAAWTTATDSIFKLMFPDG